MHREEGGGWRGLGNRDYMLKRAQAAALYTIQSPPFPAPIDHRKTPPPPSSAHADYTGSNPDIRIDSDATCQTVTPTIRCRQNNGHRTARHVGPQLGEQTCRYIHPGQAGQTGRYTHCQLVGRSGQTSQCNNCRVGTTRWNAGLVVYIQTGGSVPPATTTNDETGPNQ